MIFFFLNSYFAEERTNVISHYLTILFPHVAHTNYVNEFVYNTGLGREVQGTICFFLVNEVNCLVALRLMDDSTDRMEISGKESMLCSIDMCQNMMKI